MRKTGRFFIFYIICLLLLFLLSSCANPYLQEEKPLPTLYVPHTPSPSPQAGDPEAASGKLVLGIYGYDTLNPLKTENEALRKYLTLVYESLVTLGKDASPEPQLAKEWATTDGGITWKFTIRDDVTYHDGAQCTVYDVKNTLEWISENGGAYAACASGITAYNILSPFEIEIVLRAPDAFLPCKMIFPVIKSEELGNFTQPNGTGKYRYSGTGDDGSFLFQINRAYYGAYPKTASFEIRNYENAAALYESDADVMLCFDDHVIKYAKRAGYTVCEYTDSVLSCLLPSKNTDLTLRNDISAALDRRLLVNAAIAGSGIEKLLPLAEGTYYRKHGDSLPPVEKTGTAPASINMIVNESDKDLLRLSAVIKSQLASQNIECIITSYKAEEYEAAVRAGAYDFAVMNLQIGLWPDLYDLFATEGNLNYNHYSDASMDSLLNSLRTAYRDASVSGVTDFPSFAQYAEAQIEKIAVRAEETLPIIGLYSKNASVLIKNTVKGAEMHNFTFWNTLDAFGSWYVEN
ncbi:MAG: ABC transporter substrate-binding protein [Clostridia bacterium]